MQTLKSQLSKFNAEAFALRQVLDYLIDGDPRVFTILYFVKSNYKEWDLIFKYLKDNRIRGKAIVELFQNESPDGGGYHMGVTFILSRMKGLKNSLQGIKIDQLK